MGLQVVDLNNDGNLDLTFTTQSGVTKYFTGDGVGGFEKANNLKSGSRVAMTYHDLDDDGDLDMVGAGNRVADPEGEWSWDTRAVIQRIINSGTVSAPIFSSGSVIYKNSDGGDIDSRAPKTLDPVVYDFDYDGDLDFLIQRFYAPENYNKISQTRSAVDYYEGIGNGVIALADTFMAKTEFSGMYRIIRPTMGDLNNDGAVDMIFTYGSSGAGVYIKWGVAETSLYENIGYTNLNHVQHINETTIKGNTLIIGDEFINNSYLKLFDLRGKNIATISLLKRSIYLKEYFPGKGIYVAQVVSNKGVSVFKSLLIIK